MTSSRLIVRWALAVCFLTAARPVCAEVAPGSLDVEWNEGAEDCGANPQPPLQVHRYDEGTFILRESLCATSEAPFLYLLIGTAKALLVDTGDVADPKAMPLAKTVIRLLPGESRNRLPLVVVHTHGHLDHRGGDAQFESLPNVEVAPFTLGGVQQHFGFTAWPNGVGQIDLGDRTVDVIPTPGHHPAHVAFYDRNTGLFLSGDFLLPGRLLIDDRGADLESALRVAAFVSERPVAHVLGAHIELNRGGETFGWGSHHHPQEHALPLTKADLLALPEALGAFNGFYTRRGNLILINPIHNLIALGSAAVVALVALGVGLVKYLRRRRRAPKGS